MLPLKWHPAQVSSAPPRIISGRGREGEGGTLGGGVGQRCLGGGQVADHSAVVSELRREADDAHLLLRLRNQETHGERPNSEHHFRSHARAVYSRFVLIVCLLHSFLGLLRIPFDLFALLKEVGRLHGHGLDRSSA